MICRVCDSTDLDLAIDLGMQPWGNNFLRPDEVGHEPFYPLRVLFCRSCSTAQLDYTVPKETMFSDHTYVSGTTESLRRHFRSLAELVDSRYLCSKSSKSVLDIGSNDGTQLAQYKELGYDVLGVEASRGIAKLAVERGIPTVNDFFNLELARSLKRSFDVINASGVFFHLEELHSVTDGIRECLAPDGVFVVQFIYAGSLVRNNAFDQIYHEHLLYYTLETIQALLGRHCLEMFDAFLSPIHGGSIMGFVGHKGHRAPSEELLAMRREEAQSGINTIDAYQALAVRMGRVRHENLAFLHSRAAEGKVIFGLGAPVKGNTLLNYFGIGPNLIPCLLERSPLRRGLFAPGSHIPVLIEPISPEHGLPSRPDVYYVLAWNFKHEILKRYADDIAAGTEFFFPVDPDKTA